MNSKRLVCILLIVCIFFNFNFKRSNAASIAIGYGSYTLGSLLLDLGVTVVTSYLAYDAAEKAGIIDSIGNAVNDLIYSDTDGSSALNDYGEALLNEQKIIEFDKYKNDNKYNNNPPPDDKLIGIGVTASITKAVDEILKSANVQYDIKSNIIPNTIKLTQDNCRYAFSSHFNGIFRNTTFVFPKLDDLVDCSVDGSRFKKGYDKGVNVIFDSLYHEYTAVLGDYKDYHSERRDVIGFNSYYYEKYIPVFNGYYIYNYSICDNSGLNYTDNDIELFNGTYGYLNYATVNGEAYSDADTSVDKFFSNYHVVEYKNLYNSKYSYYEPFNYNIYIGYTDFYFRHCDNCIYFFDTNSSRLYKCNSDYSIDYDNYQDFSDLNNIRVFNNNNNLKPFKYDYAIDNMLKTYSTPLEVPEAPKLYYHTASDLKASIDSINEIQKAPQTTYHEDIINVVTDNSKLSDASIVTSLPVINPGYTNNSDNNSNGDDNINSSDMPTSLPASIDWTDIFPFCLPFDLYDILKCFKAEPKAPIIKIPFFNLNNDYSLNQTDDLIIDLSTFDFVAKIFRFLILVLFIIGLIKSTNNIVGGGKT